MIDRALGEAPTHRKTGVAGADDDGCDAAHASRSLCVAASWTLRSSPRKWGPSLSAAHLAPGSPLARGRTEFGAWLPHLDGDVGRIGHVAKTPRALLRLRNEPLDILALGAGIDLVGNANAAEAVAHIVVDAEDALNVHVAFDRRLDRAQLDIAVLSDGGDAR